MKQIISSGIVVLTIFYLGYFTAISTLQAKAEEVTKKTPITKQQVKQEVLVKLPEIKGLPAYPPDLSNIQD